MVDKEAKTPCETCTNVVESCSIHRHYVSKDYCTPVINEVCSGSKEGKLVVGHMPRKTSAVARCFYGL